jgi:hypothetical protein
MKVAHILIASLHPY